MTSAVLDAIKRAPESSSPTPPPRPGAPGLLPRAGADAPSPWSRVASLHRSLAAMHVALGVAGLALRSLVPAVRVDERLVGLVCALPAAVFLGSAYLLERWRDRARYLAAIDLIAITLMGALYGAVIHGAGTDEARRWSEALLMAALLLRAGVVPSPLARTIAGGGLAYAALYLSSRLGPAALHMPFPEPSWVAPVTVAAVTLLVSGRTSAEVRRLDARVAEAERLGSYRLVEPIGRGGMGEVWRAEHAALRRPTAIKLMAAVQGEAAQRRFDREAQITASLTHPNTIAVFDYGRAPDGRLYYAMELVDGPTLEELTEREGPLSAERAVPILRQIAGALAEAHDAGLIHGDVKPANVLLTERAGERDFVKLVDFGLARPLRPAAAADESRSDLIRGTPAFIAPEAVTAEHAIDARADVYSFGALAFFVLTGEHVFTGSDVIEMLAHHVHSAPRSLRAVPVSARTSPRLERLVARCLAKTPAERPASMAEISAELEAISEELSPASAAALVGAA